MQREVSGEGSIMLHRLLVSVAVFGLIGAPVWAETSAPLPDYVIEEFGIPPDVPEGALSVPVLTALDELLEISLDQARWAPEQTRPFETIAQAKDPRLVWTLVDMQRFAWRPEFRTALRRVSERILDKNFEGGRQRADVIDTMIAWDIPSYPGYLDHKRRVFTHYVSGWENIFVEGNIAWHLVDWGGVNIDARPYGMTDEACNNCILAIDNPETQSATEATWLKDDDIVFGLMINGEARAYPRRIMEVREMVNDTLGGRDFALPYCTLCGAAQAYFTDDMPPGVVRPIMRTSGLLIRSNKLMYDIETGSVFDTFLGAAVTGPLFEIGVALEPIAVITSDWAAWRRAYPETTVLIEDLALGRDFNLRETRDAHGPVFPVGDVDLRLPVHEDVIGVIAKDGTPVAFSRAAAVAALAGGQSVELLGVRLRNRAGGLYAVDENGDDLGSHEAFWFAWAQFHPKTVLWGE
jgi:hypothetical protein